jgi:hypothetical protein
MQNAEMIVQTWREIARYTPYSEVTLRKKYGPEMLKAGFAFKSNPGRAKRPMVWSFPSLIKAYISKKQSLDGKF